MKFVIAPDSFKGSISAKNICTSIKRGIQLVYPSADIVEVPLADGGEGTMDIMVWSSNGYKKEVTVKDPLGKEIQASYGVLGDGNTVVIELAEASGLTLIPQDKLNPLITSSYGTGQLIKQALNDGYRNFIIGVGGSATNDGGMGMLKSLGVKFYDENGSELTEGGGSLSKLVEIDDSNIHPDIKKSTFTIASDVNNKLCGPLGASIVFGPQKGATSEIARKLDNKLNNFAEVVLKEKGIDMRLFKGGGAAGGVGAALQAFLKAEMRSGIDVVMDYLDFNSIIEDADLVIVGEGKIDSQTASGKVISGITKNAKIFDVPVIALCGTLDLENSQLDSLGLLSAFSIVPGPCTLKESFENAPQWITKQTEAILRVVKLFNKQE